MAKLARFWVVALIAASALLAPAGAWSQGAKRSAEIGTNPDQLKPGEFTWAPKLAPQGPMVMVVSLKRQRAYVYRNGVRIGVSTVSTGKKGKDTPTGVFTVLQKKQEHYSNLYNNAPMPYMQRLTWDGIALHAGHLPGKPASHGCIRLPMAFAKALYGETAMGMTVVITDEAPSPEKLDSGDLLTPVNAKGGAAGGAAPAERLGANEGYRWQPELAASGPVTLVLSAQDARLMVLRNGKVIGRGKVSIPQGRLVGTHALSFTGFDGRGRGQWIWVGVPGQDARQGQPFDLSRAADLQIDPGYLAKVRSVLTPGATLLATDGGILSGGTGQPVKLIESDGKKS